MPVALVIVVSAVDHGRALTESDVAAAWQTSPQEVLVRLTAAGPRRYADH